MRSDAFGIGVIRAVFHDDLSWLRVELCDMRSEGGGGVETKVQGQLKCYCVRRTDG